MISERQKRYMRLALERAEEASRKGDVPVGAVLVRGEKVLATGGNVRVQRKNPLGHAELEVLAKAAEKEGSWRFDGAELYVTLEPCIMCCGALLQCRVGAIHYGASDPRAGGAGSLYNIPEDSRMPFRCKVYKGILEEECKRLLQDFFLEKRKKGVL
ncbi:MAG TPA: nucleoside deaminase [Synergistaceae bacterium]|nr:nucleoside deaminase [Synergistaceae bacterium]HPJ25607.1 nucleoside deaminase [Synergistaceae bacterium]HPQ36127.1 nucleoside deaminase [Synergistaceae bacterium]